MQRVRHQVLDPTVHVVSMLIDTGVTRGQTAYMDDADKQDTINKVTDRIVVRHPEAPRTLIARIVTEEYEQLASGRIRTFIPTLVEHGARNRIRRQFSSGTVDSS